MRNRSVAPFFTEKVEFALRISLNFKNLGVCVVNETVCAVIVVNQAGKLRFKYTVPPSPTKEPFHTIGVCTDSHSRILISDNANGCIHILDQNGQFLQFINNCDLHVHTVYVWTLEYSLEPVFVRPTEIKIK